MEVEHYLTAVSRAIETCQEALDNAHERYAMDLRRVGTTDPLLMRVVHLTFEAEVARAIFAFQDTRSNLRKWPLQ